VPQQDHINALTRGARLRDYRIEQVLGAGSFGITYKAVEEITDRPVAIKEYLPTSLAARDRDGTTVRPVSEAARDDFQWGLDRFRSEARLLVQLRHPNIVHVLSYFEAHGTGYLVMVFQQGRSLGELVARGGTLPEARLLGIMAPLLDGVEAVHALGFLHRDIKPDNIYIRDDGTPVLLDFGAARQALGQHSRSLTAVLTEGYAPYEQYERDGEQGPWSDVYALGALMYRCLLGKIPPDAPQRVSARMRDRPHPLGRDLARLAETCAPATAAAITAALAVAEKDRPQSVAALRGLLRGAAETPRLHEDATLVPGAAPAHPLRRAQTALSSETTLGAPAGAARRKRRLLPIAAALAAAALAGGTAAYFAASPAPTDPAARAPDKGVETKRIAAEREAEAKRSAEAASRRKAEEEKRKAEEDARRRAEDQRQKAEEEKRKAAEAERQKAEEGRRKAEEDARRKRELTEKAEGYVQEARRLLAVSRAATLEFRFADARRALALARSLLDEAEKIDSWTPGLSTERRSAGDLEGLINSALEERVRVLLSLARQYIRDRRFDDAQRSIDEAQGHDPASSDVAAARRELEEARGNRDRADRIAAQVAEARRLLQEARSALRDVRFSEARRLIAEARLKLDAAEKADSAAPGISGARQEAREIETWINSIVETRIRTLLFEAKGHIGAGRLDDAQRLILEARGLDPDSSEVASALSELEEAKRRKTEAEKKRPRLDLLNDMRAISEFSMAELAKMKSRNTTRPERAGQPIRYRQYGRHKAVAMCFDWAGSKPNGIEFSRVGVVDGYASEDEAIQAALSSCRNNAPANCECQVVDVNDQNVLLLPESYISRFYE